MTKRRRRSFVERRRALARFPGIADSTLGLPLTGEALEAALARRIKDGERSVTIAAAGCFGPEAHGLTPAEEREALKELVAVGWVEVREWKGGLRIDMSPLKRFLQEAALSCRELPDRRLAATGIAEETRVKRALARMRASNDGTNVGAARKAG